MSTSRPASGGGKKVAAFGCLGVGVVGLLIAALAFGAMYVSIGNRLIALDEAMKS